MKLHINYDRCTGHGICEGLAEDVFEVKDEGWVVLRNGQPDEERRADVEAAIQECPTRALSIED